MDICCEIHNGEVTRANRSVGYCFSYNVHIYIFFLDEKVFTL